MTVALEANVEHRVGEFQLSIAFAVDAGLAVLFGPSGAGKSLTLALVAGLVRPDGGRICIGGRVVADAAERIHLPTQQRRVGMVFQDGLLLPHRSVIDNVALAVRRPGGRQERRKVARDWLTRVGAEHLAQRLPSTLSGGQRQRVALARGLAGDPQLLLLDEPISALDLAVRLQLRALIREVVVTAGVPSLLVTHDREEAEELGDLIIDYEDGTIAGVRRIRPGVSGRAHGGAGPAAVDRAG